MPEHQRDVKAKHDSKCGGTGPKREMPTPTECSIGETFQKNDEDPKTLQTGMKLSPCRLSASGKQWKADIYVKKPPH